MRKQIKRYGNSDVIVFTKEDMSSYGLKTNDVIDLGDIVKVLPNEISSKKMLKQIKDEIDPIGTRKRLK